MPPDGSTQKLNLSTAWLPAALGIAISTWPAALHAQDMSFDLDEVPDEESSETNTEPDAEGEATEDDSLDFIGELSTNAPVAEEDVEPRPKETSEEIYAVQQIFALRKNRFELSPAVGFTVNDPFVSHPSIGASINYWLTNVLAVGANFLWYQGLENESDLNFFIRRSTRLAVPITEYQLGAHLNFTYVPLYGKFAMFNNYIFQWDAYVVGGVGMMRTRPVPVIDPNFRSFDFDQRLAFNAGIGIRVFVSRWLAVFGELRDYAFLEKLENRQISSTPEDPDTWLASDASLTNNVTMHLGIALFLPPSFDYKLPK